MPIFRVKSVKIYTGQKKIYTDIPVAPVTNIRYVWVRSLAGHALIMGALRITKYILLHHSERIHVHI